jgi:hypothetical protein
MVNTYRGKFLKLTVEMANEYVHKTPSNMSVISDLSSTGNNVL